MTPDREERIRHRAYELWEAEGRPEGKEEEHWQRAAREIEAEEPGDPTVQASDTEGGSGLSSGLQPGGTTPGASPATSEGSIGTGGGSTARRRTGTAKRSPGTGNARTAKK